jgi:hypothetical protein
MLTRPLTHAASMRHAIVAHAHTGSTLRRTLANSAAAATSAASAPPAAASSSSAAAAAPASSPPAWGPRSRLLAPSLPAAPPRRGPVVSGAATVVRKLPLKYSRLEADHPNSKTEQYELHAAVIVERWPKVLREEPEWRTEYHRHFAPLRAKKQRHHAIPKELQVKEEEGQTGTGTKTRRQKRAFEWRCVVAHR